MASCPGEQANVASRVPDELAKMQAARGQSLLEARAHAGATQGTDIDAKTKERLKALGYVN